jgi:hypothetical protein
MVERQVVPEIETLEQRAVDFIDRHVFVSEEAQESYYHERLTQWFENVKEGETKPFWLRRTFDMGSEFAAVIDYGIVTPEKQLVFGFIELADDEVSAYVPGTEGAAGPERVMSERFDFESLGRAIEMIEAAPED